MPKILIIEDDEDFREGLSFSLQSEGYETMEAATAREAFERLDEIGRASCRERV